MPIGEKNMDTASFTAPSDAEQASTPEAASSSPQGPICRQKTPHTAAAFIVRGERDGLRRQLLDISRGGLDDLAASLAGGISV
jgi:hypothetical protein